MLEVTRLQIEAGVSFVKCLRGRMFGVSVYFDQLRSFYGLLKWVSISIYEDDRYV